jgi:2'-5' RNA ligase
MLKNRLNGQLCKLHLEGASSWPNTWDLILTSIDQKLQDQMETHHNHLNKKVDRLQENQTKPITAARNPRNIHFYPRIRNLTNIKFTNEELEILNYGLQHSVEKHLGSYLTNLITETETAIKLLDPKIQNTYRHMASKK